MRDYSAVLAESVLRHRAWFAEHCARIETELAGKVKSEFIANMSHELRTPLNTIIGFAKLLGEQQMRRHRDEQIVEYTDLIRDAATHLLAVINDILDISKLQSGKYTVDSKEVDLEEVLQLSLAALKPAAIARGILMESLLEAELPSVRGDAGKLRQVFGNLISNAIKFTPAGGSVTVARPCPGGRRRRCAHLRYGDWYDEGGGRAGTHALRPGRCRAFPLAGGHQSRAADR